MTEQAPLSAPMVGQRPQGVNEGGVRPTPMAGRSVTYDFTPAQVAQARVLSFFAQNQKVAGICDFEPPFELPMTWVACGGCGELVPLHEPSCTECGLPQPRRLDERRPA